MTQKRTPLVNHPNCSRLLFPLPEHFHQLAVKILCNENGITEQQESRLCICSDQIMALVALLLRSYQLPEEAKKEVIEALVNAAFSDPNNTVLAEQCVASLLSLDGRVAIDKACQQLEGVDTQLSDILLEV